MKIITAIELGSNKIAAATAGIEKDGKVWLLAMEDLRSRGITRGDITDINKSVEDISSIVNRLERKQKRKTKSVFAAIKGADIKMEISRGMIPLSKTPREIAKKDIKRCLEVITMVRLPLDKTIVEKIVRGFYIDGAASTIRNPIGLYGIRLEAEAFIAIANMSKIQNITKCIDHAGLLLDGICLSSIASSQSVLDGNEKEKGVLLLDIGSSLTEGLVFKEGMLRNFYIIEKGASALLDDNAAVNKAKLDALLEEARVAKKDDFCSIVVTGGGALLDGVIEATEKIFKIPARIGIVKNTGQNLSPQEAVIHTATIGLIERIAKEYKGEDTHKNPIHKTFHKILDIYESYF